MNNFSPNMLKTFDECQQKFFFKYIEKLSLPQRSAIFEKGKKIHALANYYLNGFDISKMEKTLNSDEKEAWESLKTNKYFQLDVVNTEYSLTCKVGDYWIGGRLDALMKLVEKSESRKVEEFEIKNHSTYIILDYKTGNIPQNAEHDFQTITYLLCADKLLHKKGGYETLKFVYLGLKKNEQKEIILTPDLKSEYEQRIISVCDKISNIIASQVTKNNSLNCTNCEYHKLCKIL